VQYTKVPQQNTHTVSIVSLHRANSTNCTATTDNSTICTDNHPKQHQLHGLPPQQHLEALLLQRRSFLVAISRPKKVRTCSTPRYPSRTPTLTPKGRVKPRGATRASCLNRHLWGGEQRQEQQEQAAVRKQVRVTSLKHYAMCIEHYAMYSGWLRPSVAGVSCNVVACGPLCNILLLLFRQRMYVKQNSSLQGFLVGPRLTERIGKMHRADEVEPVRPSVAR
jgi:hypothetical protein